MPLNKYPSVKISAGSGITLIELCIAHAVIALISAISWPVLRASLSASEIETACKKLSSTILYARDMALSENRRYKIEFDPENKSYRMLCETENAASRFEFERIAGYDASNMRWDKKISVKAISASSIIFEPDGSADNFNIVFESRQAGKYSLTYDNLKGRCEIKRI